MEEDLEELENALHDVQINFIEIEKSISMVEKDIEANEREMNEMEEEFVNLEKLQAQVDLEGERYLSSFKPPSMSVSRIHDVSCLLCLKSHLRNLLDIRVMFAVHSSERLCVKEHTCTCNV